ncbi:MAG: PKD domain-containing protein [Bacteroidota bacterium]
MRHWVFLILFFSIFSVAAQIPCPQGIDVNLTANPTAVFSNSYPTIGPLTTNCCPSSASDGNRCVKFNITLHPGAMGIKFEMNPAQSGGVYRVGCSSTPVNVGAPVCLTGPGPHVLTFCNSAQITSLFKIISIPKSTAGPDISVSQGCSKIINAGGYDSTTVVWTSVPNNPAYNALLSCTTCLRPTVTPGASPPPYVDYRICGTSVISGCAPQCDTVRVFFTPPLAVTISPANPAICNGQTPNSTTITANGTGGSGTYTYLWNNINPAQNIVVPSGFYTIVLSDGSGCTASSIVEVKKFTVPVSVNAGPDKTVCKQNPISNLAGTVAGATGGIWSGGGGFFSPNNTTLTGSYTPTTSELSLGYVDLTLTTIGNGTCAAVSDVVRINYQNFTGTITTTPSLISCYGGNNGSAVVSVAGGNPPHTFSWNTVPAQTSATATNLSLGNYTVTVTNNIGCTSPASVMIAQPATISLASTLAPVSCPGGSNGSVSIIASGGTPPFYYLWQPGNQTTASISGKPAGTYSVTVTDSKSCSKQETYTIIQPSAISVSLAPTAVSCYNGIDGTATSTVTGGTPPYSYNWSAGGSAPNASSLQAGTYTLTVTDNLACTAAGVVTITQPGTMIASATVVNETCNNLNNGSATAAISGGTPGYTYLWQPGAYTSSSINNLSSGTYTLSVTDSRGCAATSFPIVNEPATLAINFISQVNVSCYTGNDGVVTASPSGGNIPYTYNWVPGGATTASRSNLTAGTYTVTVNDFKGCTTTNSVVITQPSALLTIAAPAISNVTCNAGNNGSIALTPNGGTPPYTFLWQPGNQTTSTVTGLTAGSYTAIIKDSKGCQITTNHAITQPAPAVISLTSTPVSCVNGNNGSVNSSIVGGTSPYTYSWIPGSATTSSISNLTAGKYVLTVQDAQGCHTKDSITLIQPTPIIANATLTHVVCSGGSSGSISLAPTGGTGPYTYLWSPGNQTTSSINSLTIGAYTSIITDSKGCQFSSTHTINQLTLTIALTPTNVSCFGGNNGTISALPSGGTPNFSYLWTPGGATTNSIADLTAGTYTLSITDFKGCVATNTATIIQPSAIIATASSTNKTCSNLNNGTATVNPTGGTPGYTYVWQPGLQTTSTISNLSSGTYTITVTDSLGCTASATRLITQPAPLVVSFTGQTNVSTCYGASNGAVATSVTGGTPNYIYLWMPGSVTSSALTNITAGTYSITATDNQGCIATNSVIITQPTAVAVSTTKTDETCNYLNNGTATATGSGGTPGSGYTYLWQPGSLTGGSISGLSAGTCTVTVTDSKSCTATKNVVIAQPAVLAVTFSGQINVSCSGGANGAITSATTGGTANYTYSWAPGGATTANRTNLTAGTHTLNVTDSKGCTAFNSVTIVQPTALSVSITSTNENCSYSNNGTATAVPSGGTPGYTYSWQSGLQTTITKTGMTAGTYTVTVKDLKGCIATAQTTITEPPVLAVAITSQTNVSCKGGSDGALTVSPSGGTAGYTYSWSPGGATTASRTGLIAGTHTVTITDSKLCSVSKAIVITEPVLLSVSVTRSNETCDYLNNGTATASPYGGTTPYTYLWQPGALTTSSISGLASGTYTVIVTDAKSCSITKTVIITEPLPLSISFNNQTNVSCFGGNNGAVSATISGGAPNYTYSWTPGVGTANAKFNLTAGTYSLTTSDNNGCVATNSVTITQPLLFSVSAISTPATCNGLSDGTASAVAAGGTGPYSYKWAPGGYTSQNITGLAAGTYIVTATDSKGCTSSNSVIVAEPAPLVFTVNTTNSGCSLPTGTASVSVAGGLAPYSYLWYVGTVTFGTGTSINNLFSDHYNIEVTDANGCISLSYADVIDDFVPLATITVTNALCFGDSTGTAMVSTTGGFGTFSYQWLPFGGTGTSATGLPKGTYTVKITTSPNGCKTFVSAKITEPTKVFTSLSTSNVSCFGGNDGTATASPTGGTPGYTYQWLPGGQTGASISNLLASPVSVKSYTVTAFDLNNCASPQVAFEITQPTSPISVTASSTNVPCFGQSTGTLSSTTATGGTGGPYSYIWTPGNLNGQNFTKLFAGTYTLTVTDAKGCTGTSTTTITQPPLLSLSFINQTNVSCYGGNNGAVTASPSGGTLGYTYYWLPTTETTATINNLRAGKDSLIITDFNGCTAGSSTIITQPTLLSVNTTQTNETCDYLNNGTANVSSAGGTPPYSYSWLPGSFTTAPITNLASATYSVTVTDFAGCTAKETAIVDEPALLGITFSSQTDISCFGGNDGSITATASGGTLNYNYFWMPGSATTTALSSLTSQTYTLTVTDNNSCIAKDSVTIAQPAATISASLTFTPVSCYSGMDGSVSASATGGTAPYNYDWMPGNLNGQNLSKLSANTYTVTITDSKGCIFVTSITVTQAPAMVLTPSSINSKCSFANGQASIAVSGGTPSYTYEWLPSGGTSSVETGLLAGTYTVSVTDNNMCVDTMSIMINDNPGPTVTVSSTTDVSCYGIYNGSATATASGTSGPFTYSWSPSGGTNATASGLSPGIYLVTVKDTNLCQSLLAESPEILMPSPIYIALNKTTLNCFGDSNGSVTSIVSGGTPGYTYLWSPGGSTETNLSNLSANTTYSVQVTDLNGCTESKSFTINQPAAALAAALTTAPVKCFGEANGSVSAAVSGGTSPYNYFWMPGSLNGKTLSNLSAGTYTVTIVDSKGCSLIDSITVSQPNLIALTVSSINSTCSFSNGKASVAVTGGIIPYTYQWAPSGGTNALATDLIAGSYTVTVSDSNSCTFTEQTIVGDNPSPLVTITSTTNVSCNGGTDGTASPTVLSSFGPFTYSWMPSGSTDSIATGLLPGNQTLIITDTNLCQSLPVISAEITEPDSMFIVVTTSEMSCFGGNNETASANVSGGTPTYSYLWLPGGGTGSNVSNLSANTYTVQVTDANSCLQIKSFTITEPTLLTSSISSSTNVSCFGGNDGTATVDATGGTPVYSYEWLPIGGNAPMGQGLTAGTFTVTITDFNGCVTLDSVTISEPLQALSATSTMTAVTCFGTATGTAHISSTGGTAGYSYLWSPSVSVSDTAFGLVAGDYYVTVTDIKSCKTTLLVSVTEPAVLGGSLVSINPSCSQSNGSISTQASGGTYPYSYLWSPGGKTDSYIDSLTIGTFSVTITDVFNCTISLSDNLTIAPDPVATISSTSDPLCFGGNDGSATVTIAQGTAPFIISWSPSGGNGLTAFGLTLGTYVAHVTDALGCIATDTAILSEPTPIAISLVSVTDVLCNGQSTGVISVSAADGTGPLYSYLWAPSGSTLATATSLAAGTHTVTVTDQNNCQKAISINIEEPTPFTSVIDSVKNPICYNGFGNASVLASGGILPYSYAWAPAGDSGSTSSNILAGSYTVTVTDANGCTTNSNAIISQPSQIITSASSNDTLCLGQSGSVSATATGGAGNYYYAWQPSGAITAGTLPITPTADVTYTVVAFDQIGCSGTPDNTSITVYTLNNTSIQAYATSPICPGQSTVVYAEATGNTGVLTYQWNNNLGTGPGVFLVTPSQPTTYIVTVSNVCISVSDTVDVLFNPPPTVGIISDTTALCVPGTIQFFDNSVSGNPDDPITSWNWSFGDGTSSILEDPGHTYTLPADMPVILTVTTSGGCTNNNSSLPLIISGHPYPTAAFSVNSTELDLPYDLLICNNQSIGATFYNWDFGDGQTSTQENPQYSYPLIGAFQIELIVTSNYGCMDTAYAEVTTNADVVFPNGFTPNPDGSSGGSYDPNSLNNNVFFPYTAGVVEYRLEVYNRWGEMIFESMDVLQGWDGYYKGKLCPQDVYIWKAFIKLNNGKTFDKNGNIMIIH